MSDESKIYSYKKLNRLTQKIRDDLNNYDFVLLFAYNGTGKTRLSMEFKEIGKKHLAREFKKTGKNNAGIDTLYFNILRSILEKTSTFLGYSQFSKCINNLDNETLYARALNLLSHGNYSIYEPREMVEDNKELFKTVFNGFVKQYNFNLDNE